MSEIIRLILTNGVIWSDKLRTFFTGPENRGFFYRASIAEFTCFETVLYFCIRKVESYVFSFQW